MFRENLDADGNQDDSAEERRLVFHQRAKALACKGAEETAEGGDYADEGNGKVGVRVGKRHRQSDPRRQGVDAGRHRLGKDQLISKGRGIAGKFRVSEILNGFDKHFSTQKSQKYQGDPMVHHFHVLAEGGAGKIADERHQRLKYPETDRRGDQFFPFLRIADPVGDRYGKGVHG